MKVPFYGADREYHYFQKEIDSAIRSVFQSGQMLQGRWVRELEEKIAIRCCRKHAIAVGSCTDALFFALKVLGIDEDDEVLVSSFSFKASAEAIVRLGARPVFVDIDPITYNMSLDDAENEIDDFTAGMVYPYMFGLMNDPNEIDEFAWEHGIIWIEDAAQVFGARYGAIQAGRRSDVGCLSFDPTKLISAPGSGGMCLTDSSAWAEMIRGYRYHGKGAPISWGYNSQMSSICAAVLLVKLGHMEELIARRRVVAQNYQYWFTDLPFQIPWHSENSLHLFHKFVIQLEDSRTRGALKVFLADADIDTRIHYKYSLPYEFKMLDQSCPVAAKVSDCVLSLPIHPFLTDAEIKYVVDKVVEFFDKGKDDVQVSKS